MPVTVPQNRFLLLYGSQTGQAKAIAEEIVEKAEAENLQPQLFCLSQTEKKFYLEREHCVVIITSTTGDGEPPDTALKFVRRLKKKTLANDHLSKLNYAILGLGDSNYTNFCNCGKTLDRRLLELGAKHFYPPGWADDAVGLEVAVEPWIDGLWAAVKNFLNKDITGNHGQSICDSQNGPEHAVSSCNQTDSSLTCITKESVDSCDKVNINSAVVRTSDTSSNCDKIIDDRLTQHGLPSSVSDLAPVQDDMSKQINNNTQESTLVQNSNMSQQTDNHTQEPNSSATHASSSGSPDIGDSPVVKAACWKRSLPPLCESTLTVPALSPAYLAIEYNQENVVKNCSDQPLQNGCEFPSAASPVAMATVVSMTTLTAPTAVKTAMSVTLDVSDAGMKYSPGDSFSLICPNNASEVETLLSRLNVADQSDVEYSITVIADTKKRNACVPKHVPEVSSLRHIFTTCLDIREPPKKALLRVLVEYTTDQSEKRRLQELCSKQGAEDYSRFIREPSLSIQDILDNFPSCNPPVQRLVELLPRLQPRPYSVCSSPLCSPGRVEFVFNIVDVPATQGRTYSRKGVCTGWLQSLSAGTGSGSHDLTDQIANFSIQPQQIKVPVFSRTNQHFHLPDDLSVPLILIGPGTGVAPFVGFLDQRAALKGSNCDNKIGDIWLFYGCRHKDRDYLFRERLEKHVTDHTLTQLLVSFSRDDQAEDAPRYVQDNIRAHGQTLVHLLEEKKATVYVCGDAKNMAKDVNQAFVDIYCKQKCICEDEAKKVIMKLRLARQYLEDVWT